MRAGHLLHWIVRARHLSTLFAITANHIPVNPTMGSNTDNDHWLNYVFFSGYKKSIHHHNVNIKYELSYFGFMLHKSGNNLEIIEQLIRLRLPTLVWLMVARLKADMRISGISISHLMVKRRHAAKKKSKIKGMEYCKPLFNSFITRSLTHPLSIVSIYRSAHTARVVFCPLKKIVFTNFPTEHCVMYSSNVVSIWISVTMADNPGCKRTTCIIENNPNTNAMTIWLCEHMRFIPTSVCVYIATMCTLLAAQHLCK